MVLDQHPSVVHVVPLASAICGYHGEVTIEPDAGNGIETVSAAHCHQADGKRLLGDLATERSHCHGVIERTHISYVIERLPIYGVIGR